MPRFRIFQPGLVQISGTLMASVSSSLTNPQMPTPALSGNLNIRRKTQRQLYGNLIAGNLKFYQTDQTVPSGISNQAPAFVPSWTQARAGKKHGHVIAALSTSYDPLTNNAYFSGTTQLEVSPRAATGSLWYGKQTKLRRLVYAVTASANLQIYNTGSNPPVPTFEFGTRTQFVAVSGNYLSPSGLHSAGHNAYAGIPIYVPDHGKIRNIRVWVELVSDIRTVITSSGLVTFGADPTQYNYGTTGIALNGITLQPPSSIMKGLYGRPLLNIPQAGGVRLSGFGISGGDLGWGKTMYDTEAYPLWIQGSDFPNGGQNTTGSNLGQGWMAYGTDLDMRTVFCDDSPNPSPYDGTSLVPIVSASNGFTNEYRDYSILSSTLPNTVLQNIYGPINSMTSSFSGNWVPWFVDPRIKGGYLQAVSSSLYFRLGSGSPPPGWLTGPGGTANVNEFPTTGTQLGPASIRPPWPILDDVYATLNWNTDQSDQPTAFVGSGKVIGFRPGLRGTDINGTWWLNIWTNRGMGVWFRQVRLEFLVDQGEGLSFGNPQRRQFYRKPAIPVRKTQLLFKASNTLGRAVGILTTGDALRGGTETVFLSPPEQYGRSVGITSDTGSFTDFAVFTRLTGTLADRMFASASLSVSGTAGMIYSYLNNQFGTPYIPISSGSSISPAFQYFNTDSLPTKQIVSDIIRSRPLIPQAHRIADVVSRLGGFQRRQDQIVAAIDALRLESLASGSI